jgi:hypothetical protein
MSHVGNDRPFGGILVMNQACFAGAFRVADGLQLWQRSDTLCTCFTAILAKFLSNIGQPKRRTAMETMKRLVSPQTLAVGVIAGGLLLGLAPAGLASAECTSDCQAPAPIRDTAQAVVDKFKENHPVLAAGVVGDALDNAVQVWTPRGPLNRFGSVNKVFCQKHPNSCQPLTP